jgi:hypothetical protein
MSTKVELKDMVVGEYYYYDRYVFILSAKTEPRYVPINKFIDIHTKEFYNHSSSVGGTAHNIYKATPEQKAHLDACIAAGKYVDAPKKLTVDDLKVGDIIRYQNEILCEFKGFSITTFNVDTKHKNFFNSGWEYNCKIERATPDEIIWYNACKAANKYISKEEALNQSEIFLKDEYIVLTRYLSGNFSTNYCYKQRENYKYLRVYLDSTSCRTNGLSIITKKDPSNWRYATPEEAAEYERLGKPYDVTILNVKKDECHCGIDDFKITLISPTEYIKEYPLTPKQAFKQSTDLLEILTPKKKPTKQKVEFKILNINQLNK